jgi:Ca-activated chloride channel family protein
VQQQEGTVMLSVDVSGSMQATDVSPSRLEATKAALRDFVKQQPKGVNIGLVAFSDTASLLQPPTADKDLLLRSIGQLQPERGTDIGDGLRVALDALRQNADLPPAAAKPAVTATATPAPAAQSPGTVVLLSDGESNTGPQPLDVAREAATQGVRVDTVGIGTSGGIVLHIQGQSILTRLDESTLSGIAQATGGHYYNAQDEAKLTQVYHDLAQQQHTERKSQEVTFLVVAGAMVLLIAGGALSLFWFNRLP